MVTVTPEAEYDVLNADTTGLRKFAKAKLEFQKLLIDALSQPKRDFRSIFLQTKDRNGSNSAEEVLHLLYLSGKVSLDQIEALLLQVEANNDV